MILLPVIERELRAAARSRRIYLQRFLAGLAVVSAGAWIFFDLHRRGTPEDALGSELFETITFVAVIVSLLAGMLETADAISRERREGTLGLLYLTDLRSAHVLAGKLVALSIPSFFALLAIMPMLAIPILLGGVSPGELVRACFVLLTAVFLSLCIGIFSSCLAKDDRLTRLIAFSLIFFSTVVMPLVKLPGDASPFQTLTLSSDKQFAAGGFWNDIAIQFMLSFLFLALASILARLVWRERPASAGWQRWFNRWRAYSAGSEKQRKRWRAEELDDNPAVWLASRHRASASFVWALIGVAVIAGAWNWAKYRRLDAVVIVLLLLAIHLALKVSFTLAAARPLSEEARSGSLEIILTTPLTPQRLVEGHFFGLFKRFGAAALVIMALNAAWIIFGHFTWAESFGDFAWMGIAFVILDLLAIAAYATWLGLKLGRPGEAAMRTLVFVIIIPDVLIPVLMRQFTFWSIPIAWLIIDVLLIARALPKFKSLREQAAEQYSTNSDRE
jgi:ABC-type transport system involved in multi-copper enzyme maturation permease subunit